MFINKIITKTTLEEPDNLQRRQLLKQGFSSMIALSVGPVVTGCEDSNTDFAASIQELFAAPTSNIENIGPLATEPDENGFLLPPGFSSRVLAKTDQPAGPDGNYLWHDAPDGGAIYVTEDGGWIYVSNSEGYGSTGGVGALEFDAEGNVIDAYRLLGGTTMNCAGGPTPWNSWLSCEEFDAGMVWECFPLGRGDIPAVRRDAMGVFQHEAAAIDPSSGIVYLTEDKGDGCLYRFIPDTNGDLSAGILQAAAVDQVDEKQRALEGLVSWVDVPDPSAATLTTREQAAQAGSATFSRGEGAWFHGGVLYFVTTGNSRGGGLIWAYEPDSGVLTQVYNRVDLFPEDETLNGIDNITVSSGGDLLVAEDSDDMQIQAITPGGALVPLFKLLGHDVGIFRGEITGPVFDPSGSRLYFSSQRGVGADYLAFGKPIGVTYEITGPFVT